LTQIFPRLKNTQLTFISDSLIPKLQEAGAWQSAKEVFPNSEDATLEARLIQGGIPTVAGSLNGENPRRVATIQYSIP
jgi:hypothetical protein